MAFQKKGNIPAPDDDDDLDISPGSGNSFKDIVIAQLRRVTILSSTEFRGGYYTVVTNKKGEEKEMYVQDTREVYSNAVYTLALLFQPKFDKKMEGVFTTFKEKVKVIGDDFINKSSEEEEVILGESFYTNIKDKVLFETYRNKKLTLYISLFSYLCLELARLKYMEIGGGIF